MKPSRILIVMMLGMMAASCTLDNYDMPDASLTGRFLDVLTGEQLQCDIYNGTVLQYVEDGYTEMQTNVVKADGSYSIGQMFAGTYELFPVYTNFEPVDTVRIEVKGAAEYDFVVEPYIRIKDVSILKSGLTKVTATFTVEQANSDHGVMKVGMFLHKQPIAGAYMALEAREIVLGGQQIGSKQYTITMDYKESTAIREGNTYYVRVGALSDAVNARYNYAPTVSVEL
ncbi:MAG: DUF3823 domain-containing protein [Bacteroidales bacterium]|nr:DUF3823 domain-containing protein [Bacteroidales bacterium]